jgi:hypothetical protein
MTASATAERPATRADARRVAADTARATVAADPASAIVAADPAGAERLRALYGRCRRLALGAGAAMLLDAPDDALTADAVSLAAEADAAAAEHPGLRAPFAACRAAALALHALDPARPETLTAARASQRALRAAAWTVLDPEVVPCGHAHAHVKGAARG